MRRVRRTANESRESAHFADAAGPTPSRAADVYDRVTAFLDSLFRSWEPHNDEPRVALVVAHGLTIRLLLMRYFRWSVEDFKESLNPPNCAIIMMERKATGHYDLVVNPAEGCGDAKHLVSWFRAAET